MVIIGKRTLVGYSIYPEFDPHELPPLRKGILSPASALRDNDILPEQAKRINVMYAKDFKFSNDINYLWKGFRKLGK